MGGMMLKRWCTLLVCMGLVAMTPMSRQASAQTSTPLQSSAEPRLPETCAVTVPNFVAGVCQGRGELNTITLNFPGICQQYGMTKDIEAALRTCNSDLIFVQMWKYKLGLENHFEKSFAEYVEKTVGNEIESGGAGVSLTSSFEAFRTSVLACGLKEDCHRALFGKLNQQARATLSKTPYFCDYDASVTQFDDASYRHMFFDQQNEDAVIWPMCRAYYRKYKACDGETADGGLFTLSDRFTRQYDFHFKAIQP
ncbi:hypothetical protein SAMN03159496_03828 [Rhizobium sp. NFR07]|nr:hypothetical protein SAMN03159496_03828 [Rhizobium sp. NFR07]